MKQVKVMIGHLNHDGLLRQPGEILEMEESQAYALFKLGAVEEVVNEAPPPPPSPPPPSAEENKEEQVADDKKPGRKNGK